ncbi:hypothetical protein [Streptosporangium sp. NPDC004631]
MRRTGPPARPGLHPPVPLSNPPVTVVRRTSCRIRWSSTPSFRFHGNAEGHDVPTGAVDVIVTDGLTGNIVHPLTRSRLPRSPAPAAAGKTPGPGQGP